MTKPSKLAVCLVASNLIDEQLNTADQKTMRLAVRANRKYLAEIRREMDGGDKAYMQTLTPEERRVLRPFYKAARRSGEAKQVAIR